MFGVILFMESIRVSRLMSFVAEKLSDDKLQDAGHDFSHIMRVYNAGIMIGLKENADMEVLKPALLLHDVVRPTNEEKHAELSASFARKVLPRFGYSSEETSAIILAILTHSRSDRRKENKTLEARIVYDADKQDGVGLSGVARFLLLCGAKKYGLEKTAEAYLERIIDVIKNEPPYTKAGREMANEKLGISLEFCSKILGKKYDEILHKELCSLKVSL